MASQQDVRDIRPKNDYEISILGKAFSESVKIFTLLTGAEPIMPCKRLSYNEQMNILDNQVHAFSNQHHYKGVLKLPRIILWTNDEGIAGFEEQLQNVHEPMPFEKSGKWIALGKEFARRRELDNRAIELAAKGLEAPIAQQMADVRVGSTEELLAAQLQRARQVTPPLRLPHREMPPEVQAEKTRLDNMVAENLAFYKAWLNTVAVDWYHTDMSTVLQQHRMTWEEWCSTRAAHAFVAKFELKKTGIFLNQEAIAVKEGLGWPTVSYETAKRGRDAFWFSEGRYSLADETYEFLGALRK